MTATQAAQLAALVGGGGGLAAIQKQGVPLPPEPALNLNAPYFNAVDNPGLSTDVTIADATTVQDGLMSAADKAFVNNLLGVGGNNRSQLSGTMTAITPGIALTWKIRIWLPPDITQFRLRLSSRDMLGGTGGTGAVNGVNVAVGTSNGVLPQYSITGAPQVFLNQNIPVASTELILPFITLVQVPRGVDGCIVILVGVPNQQYEFETAIGWGFRSDGTTQVNPDPGGFAAASNIGPTIAVEYVAPAGRKRLLVFGDSISRGNGNPPGTPPGYDKSFTYLMGPDHGVVAALLGANNLTLAKLAQAATDPNAWDQTNFRGATFANEAGINDLTSLTFVQYQETYGTLINNARANGAAKVILFTITPSTTFIANDALRVQVNGWLRTLPYNIDGLVDADTLLNNAGAGHPEQLNPIYDCGDGTHWNAAAHSVIEGVLFPLI